MPTTPAPPPAADTTVVKVTSPYDKARSECFVKETGRSVTPCPATAVPMDSYRHPCVIQTAGGPFTPSRVYSADVSQQWTEKLANGSVRVHQGYPPDYRPGILYFVPDGPRSGGKGKVVDTALLPHWPAGIELASFLTPQNAIAPFAVETCRGAGADSGGHFKAAIAGYTATIGTLVHQPIGVVPPVGYDAHGFHLSGPGSLLDDGTPWHENAITRAIVSAFIAAHPKADGCNAYPCGK